MTFVALPIARNNWTHIDRLAGFCCCVWLRHEVSTRVVFLWSLIFFILSWCSLSSLHFSGLPLHCTFAHICTQLPAHMPFRRTVWREACCVLFQVSTSVTIISFMWLMIPPSPQHLKPFTAISQFSPWRLLLLRNSNTSLMEIIKLQVQMKKQNQVKERTF